MTVLCHLKRGLLDKGEQVCVKTESYQGLRTEKVTINTRIDHSAKQTGNESPTNIPNQTKNSNLGSYKTFVPLWAETTHKIPEGQRPKPIKL